MILLQWSITNAGKIKAVQCEPKKTGLTIIGGKNRMGKTTVLDMLAWAIGGDRYKPIEPNRRGGDGPAELDVRFDNGIHVRRSGKNGALKVTDEKTGLASNQSTLDKFISTFALDIRQFRDAKPREKCGILLKTLGVDAELAVREQRIKEAFDHRTFINREVKQREGALAQVAKPEDPPIDGPIAIDNLVEQLQAANTANAQRQQQIKAKEMLEASLGRDRDEVARLKAMIEKLEDGIATKLHQLVAIHEPGPEQDTSTLQSDITQANALNAEYAQAMQGRREYERLDKELQTSRKAAQDADAAVEQARQARMELLSGVTMPDPDIGVEDGELTYKGDRWDQLADSDELILCCKIVSKLNPECRFILVDGLEKLDPETLLELDTWVRAAGLQVIGTRVTVDASEADLIIEDGQVATADLEEKAAQKAGEKDDA